MELKKLIGKRIQQIRKNKGITQEKLAEMIGIEVPSMSNLETGKFSPSAETLQKLTNVLNVHPWEFYFFNDLTEEEMLTEIKRALEKNPKLIKICYNFFKSIENDLR